MKSTKSRTPSIDVLPKSQSAPSAIANASRVLNTIVVPGIGASGGQIKASQSAGNDGIQPIVSCAGCHQVIRERYMLKAVDQLWHEDCLKCSCCDCRLGEVGSTLFTKANLILCKRDYLRLFGMTGYCSACSKMIPAFEMVMRAKTNVYHLECFACQQCNHRFCVGDHFYLLDNKILCEYDYEERNNLSSLTFGANGATHSNINNNSSISNNTSANEPAVINHNNNASTQLKKVPTQSLQTTSYSSHNFTMPMAATGTPDRPND